MTGFSPVSQKEKEKMKNENRTIVKADFVDVIADVTALPKEKAAEVYEAIGNTIAAAIHSGVDVILFGLATLQTKSVRPKTVCNPNTGKMIDVPARRKLRIIPRKRAKAILLR